MLKVKEFTPLVFSRVSIQLIENLENSVEILY